LNKGVNYQHSCCACVPIQQHPHIACDWSRAVKDLCLQWSDHPFKKFTNKPVIYDSSHLTCYRDYVVPISKGAMVIGAGGLMVECHPNPILSISDSDQEIGIKELKIILEFFDGKN